MWSNQPINGLVSETLYEPASQNPGFLTPEITPRKRRSVDRFLVTDRSALGEQGDE